MRCNCVFKSSRTLVFEAFVLLFVVFVIALYDCWMFSPSLSCHDTIILFYCCVLVLQSFNFTSVLSRHSHQIVTLLSYSYNILRSYCYTIYTVVLLYSYTVLGAVKAAMLLHFHTIGFISTCQHFCLSRSLKTLIGPNIFGYTLS